MKILHSLAGPVLAAAFLRCLWLGLVDVNPVSDSYMYHSFAMSLQSGRGYAYPSGELTSYWSVGTSAVYAAIYYIFGVSYAPVAWLNLALGVLLVWVTGKTAEIHLGRQVGIGAAWILALWPSLIQFTTILASELLFSALLMTAIYLFSIKDRKIQWALCWSVIIVCSIYVRSVSVPLLILLPFSLYMSTRQPKLSLAVLLICLASYFFLTQPWKIRNEAIWGKENVMSTNFGANLWMGNNPKSQGGYMDLPDVTYDNEVHRDEALRREAIHYIVNNPGSYAILVLKRIKDSFDRETIGVVWNEGFLKKHLSDSQLLLVKLYSTVFWWIFLGMGSLGLVFAIRVGAVPWHSALVLTPLILAAPAILVVSQDRYHIPMNAFFAIFSAFLISHRSVFIRRLRFKFT